MAAEFLSVAETAGVLGVSDDLVYELIQRGELPAALMGKRKLVPRRAIEAIVDRAMEGFDPDAVLNRMAGAARPEAGSDGLPTSGRTGATSPELPTPPALSLVAQ